MRNIDDLYVAAKAALPIFEEVLVKVLRKAGLPFEAYDHVRHTGNLMICPKVRRLMQCKCPKFLALGVLIAHSVSSPAKETPAGRGQGD